MAEKKLTPLQEAIKLVKSEMNTSKHLTDIQFRENAALETSIIHLESLLPKEKEFAKEIWDSPVVYYKTENKGIQMMSFDEYYKQFES